MEVDGDARGLGCLGPPAQSEEATFLLRPPLPILKGDPSRLALVWEP